MENNKPLISIIIPVYNTHEYIKRCIDSVLFQTYKNIELIVINDGSTDGSAEILDDIKKNNPKIIVIHQNNCGVSVARNKGLDLVSGKYVCFLDSDDWLTEDAVEFLYEQLKGKNKTISSCDRNFAYIKNSKLQIQRQRDPENIKYLSAKEALIEIGSGKFNLQSSCYKLFPVELINKKNKIRFDEDISNGEDGLFVFNVLNIAEGLIFSTEPKWNIFEREGSCTNSGYSPKLLTALVAVDKMICNSSENLQLQNQLKVYYTVRVIGLITIYNISNCKRKSDKKFLNIKAKKYKKEFLNSNISIFSKVKYYLLLYSPSKFIKIMYNLKTR